MMRASPYEFRQTALDGVSEIVSLILPAKIKLVRFAKIIRWPFCPITAAASHSNNPSMKFTS